MIRQASINDISSLQDVRHSVKENILSDRRLVTDNDYVEYLTKRGKGWVFVKDKNVVGFAIVDLIENIVWALFVHPDFEGQGIGRQLHDKMIMWYFTQTSKTLRLSTDKGTRAEKFYRAAGWQEDGRTQTGEVIFKLQRQVKP